MVDRLSAVIAGVDDDAIPVVQILTAGDLGGGAHQVAEERGVLPICLRERRDVKLGDDQKVSGRLRVDVGEGDAELVFVETIGGN